MFEDIQETLVGSRVRFAASFAVLFVLFVIWFLLAFIPIVGLLMAIYLLVRSAPAEERYSSF